MNTSKLTLAELLNSTPTSRVFRELVASSRMYGLTTGGINADEFGLTELGDRATGGDEVDQLAACKEAVLSVAPYGTFFRAFNGKKVPNPGPLRDFLMKEAEVDESRVEECIEHILEDARVAGLVRTMKGGEWVDLEGVPTAPVAPDDTVDLETPDDEQEDEPAPLGTSDDRSGGEAVPPTPRGRRADAVASAGPKKVFIAHGKNRTPLDQLKKALDQFKVKYAVAVDEPNRGRPISKKVAELMENECSSGIFIFTADERFLRENEAGEQIEVWRPSENVVYELGAASILYENRIVIFKEKSVSFPSDFSDLGYISFEKDQLVAEIGALFAELVGLDILEVRAKG
ncbi:TIR domain-containing protein [Nocardioides sp. NPDC092400]|uniref:TIR domain-containing protein n=1 Tax=Nocardioides sp. NPDC092400 TaxID=3155196 RepID=UPI003431FB4F